MTGFFGRFRQRERDWGWNRTRVGEKRVCVEVFHQIRSGHIFFKHSHPLCNVRPGRVHRYVRNVSENVTNKSTVHSTDSSSPECCLSVISIFSPWFTKTRRGQSEMTRNELTNGRLNENGWVLQLTGVRVKLGIDSSIRLGSSNLLESCLRSCSFLFDGHHDPSHPKHCFLIAGSVSRGLKPILLIRRNLLVN